MIYHAAYPEQPSPHPQYASQGSSNAGGAIQKQGEISNQLGQLEKQIEELHAAIGQVEDKYKLVMAPSSPQTEPGQKTPEASCGVLGMLINLNHRLSQAIACINEIRQRCEL